MPAPDAELQEALYETLVANTALSALITGVYDFVPPAAVLPYVVVGDIDLEGDDTIDRDGFISTVIIHSWSGSKTKRGRKEVKDIMSAVYDALQRNKFTVGDFTNISTMFEFSDTVQEPDGLTYHGVSRFSIKIGC